MNWKISRILLLVLALALVRGHDLKVKTNEEEVQTVSILVELDHGILMTVAWCIVADLGIILKLLRCIPYNIALHILCFSLAVAVTSHQVYRMNKEHNFIQNFHTMKPITKGHLIMALTIMGLIAITVFMGILSLLLQLLTHINPRILKLFRRLHKYIGYTIIMISKVQVIYGWVLYNQIFALVVVTSEIALVLTFLLVYCFKGNSVTQDLRTYELIGRPLTSEESVLINFLNEGLPYNSLMLKQFNYFFFNDCLYSYTSSAFHPGGRRILNLVRGREIDRYIYGMMSIEEHPGLGRLLHPQNSFDLIDQPLMVLPKNPAVNLQTNKFIIRKRVDVSSNVGLFYLESSKDGEIIYGDANNLWHVGQYFKLTGYGFTRLYSCVLSMLDENKAKNMEMISKLNIHPLVYRGINQNTTTGMNITGLNASNYLIPPETMMNFTVNDPPPTLRQQPFRHQKSYLPLLIKKHAGNTFTSRLFGGKNEALIISGLKGRGIGIEKLKKGKVFILVAGTGLYPFIDLLDALFKFIVGNQINIYHHQHRQLFEGFEFMLYGSFNEIMDIVIPTELAVMASFSNPLFSMLLRTSKQLTSEENSLMGPYMSNFRFNEQFVRKHILSVPQYQISMVYICGPSRMYPTLLDSLRKHNISQDKIFLL